MQKNYLNFKEEIEKINLRIKEYLWKKWNWVKIKEVKYRNARCQFLAR